MVIGVDKDCSRGRVYWSDISSRQILSANYNGTDKLEFIQNGNLSGIKMYTEESISFLFVLFVCVADILSPEGVAIDWISRRIYWTDSAKDTIEVASLDDPTLRATVISKNLVNPRGIAVDPHSK